MNLFQSIYAWEFYKWVWAFVLVFIAYKLLLTKQHIINWIIYAVAISTGYTIISYYIPILLMEYNLVQNYYLGAFILGTPFLYALIMGLLAIPFNLVSISDRITVAKLSITTIFFLSLSFYFWFTSILLIFH